MSLRNITVLVVLMLVAAAGHAQDARDDRPGTVKVAAVQICGYDKTDVPREGYDPTEAMVPYIDNAGKDGAQLVVFPEYVLGRIQVPGAETKKIAEAAAANQIYVIAGCWELYEDGTFVRAPACNSSIRCCQSP